MTQPTQKVRHATYSRDGFSCVNCGSFDNLSWQHRESSGHGGRGAKAPELTTADGVTACLTCNMRFEADLQRKALALGWKLRRNRGGMTATELPFYDSNTAAWYLPDTQGYRAEVLAVEAVELLVAAGSIGA